MKTLLVSASLALAVAVLSGCASPKPGLALAPIGPGPSNIQTGEPEGRLVVFSAFEAGARFYTSHPYHRWYSDYRILRNDGQLLQTVRNDSGEIFDSPTQVKLPPGTYRIVAKANGHGDVTIPVVLVAGRTTIVHLEGGIRSPNGSSTAGSEIVCFPGGQFVGWKAGSE